MAKKFILTKEIENYVINEKRINPTSSCRSLSLKVKERFGKSVSKSSINSLLKIRGLSERVGRPKKQGESGVIYDIDSAGAFFLKGIDEQLSLSVILRQFSRNALPKSNSKILEYKNNLALYRPIFLSEGLDKLNLYTGSGLWHIVSDGHKLSKSSIIKYLDNIESLGIVPGIIRGIELGIDYVTSLAFHIKKGEPFFIDPGFHLIWPTPKGVQLYSMPIIKTEAILRDILFNNEPLVLLSSKPYQPITRDLAAFLTSWSNCAGNNIRSVSLLNSNSTEIGRIDKIPSRRRDFVFAALPWQMGDLRFSGQASLTTKEKLGYLDEEFILESSEIDLSQLIGTEQFKIRMISLKNLSKQPRLSLFTNIPVDEKDNQEVANIYLKRWPSLEEAFEDMLKKIELMKYPQLAKDYKYIDSNSLRIALPQQKLSFSGLLGHLLEYLNTLCQVRYFPLEYQKSIGLSEMKARVFNLPGRIAESGKFIAVSVFYPQNYAFLQDLTYACRRFNEDNVSFKNKRLILLPKAH